MSLFRGDASEVYALANDLSQVGAKAVPALRGVMDNAGKTFERAWAANATATAGVHGKHYPASIGHEMALTIGSVAVDVGPGIGAGAGKPQSGMSFEYGSRNQPPHLDGLRALDGVTGTVEKMVDTTIGQLFP